MILNGSNTDNFMHRMVTWSCTDLPPLEEWDALVTLAIEGAYTTRKFNLPYHNLLDLHDIHKRFMIERDAEMTKTELNVPWSAKKKRS